MKKLIRFACVLMMIIGAILILGTAGASDNNIISLSQIIAQLVGSILLIGVGFVGMEVTYNV